MFTFLKRFLSNNKKEHSGINRTRITDVLGEKRMIGGRNKKLTYQSVSCLSVGKERRHNEDTIFTLDSQMHGLDESVYFGLFMVADGMGGHQSGEIASSLAARGVSKFIIDHLLLAYLFDRQTLTYSKMEKLVEEAFAEAQAQILQRVPGGGTTLTLAFVVDDDLFTAHVGDSRLYILSKDGTLSLKTKDHTLVKRLIELGEITQSQANAHPQRNVLYRALGQSDELSPDFDHLKLKKGDIIVLCTDGLWGVIDEDEIIRIIQNGPDIENSACNLVEAANQAGGPDNISVVLVERME